MSGEQTFGPAYEYLRDAWQRSVGETRGNATVVSVCSPPGERMTGPP